MTNRRLVLNNDLMVAVTSCKQGQNERLDSAA